MLDKFISYWSTKSPKEIIIIILVVVLMLWIIKTWIFPSIGDIIKKITPPKPNDGTSTTNVTPERQQFLRGLAESLYDSIYCIMCTRGYFFDECNKALGLNDSELILLNKFYGELSDNTMYYDIDWEFAPEDTADDKLNARLEELNLSMKG